MINIVSALYHLLSLVAPIGKKASLPARLKEQEVKLFADLRN
jgi:hypothetical protein